MHAVDSYVPVPHVLAQVAHCVSVSLPQFAVTYDPAEQVEHELHARLLDAVHARVSYCDDVQVVQLLHARLELVVHAVDSYVPAPHVLRHVAHCVSESMSH